MDQEQLRTGIEVKNRDILAQLIKEKCEAYILDRADEMGLTLSVDVVMREAGDYPYPVSVVLSGMISESDRLYFKKMLERDFAITPECQEWVICE